MLQATFGLRKWYRIRKCILNYSDLQKQMLEGEAAREVNKKKCFFRKAGGEQSGKEYNFSFYSSAEFWWQ